jgi:outer membrane autotransporter protein
MYTDMQSCLASLVSKPIYAQSMAVDSLRVLAAVIALSVLGADSALADSIPGTIHDKDSPVIVPSSTFPSPQVTNGTLIIGTGNDKAATLDIGLGGEVTVGGAEIGNSPNATGTVNVTGSDAIFLSTARDIDVGKQGTGNLIVTDGGLVRSDAASIIAGDKGGTGIIAAGRGARIESQINGITVKGTGIISIDNSSLTAINGEAFLVQGNGATANIFINNVNDSIHAGPGGNLLHVTGGASASLAASVLIEGGSELTGSTLTGDIVADATSSANVMLEHHTILTGAVNQNPLTGATGINPNEPIPPTIIPPLTVNLSIDSTSTWNMRASSTVNTLTVNPEAHINFAHPASAPFKTLVINNLIGTGAIFGMNVDLGAIKGDLVNILTKSQGLHLLTFTNRTQGSDLPENRALLVVRTPDGGAGFGGEADGGTFRYFVVHGDGSSVTPVKNDWYLVRGDEIKPPEIIDPPPIDPNPTPTPAPTPPPNPTPTPPPIPGPTPPGGRPTPTPTPTPPGGRPTPAPTPKDQFAPGDVLPLPPQIRARLLSRIDDLTPAANAAIGTFSATMPLFYADMDTLIERLGELRLEAQNAPAPTTTISSGISKEGGKAVVTPPPPVAPPSGCGVWVRGFGSGSHINDQVSRSFDQNLGGFQIGADKRLVTRYGDLYLGGFLGYFYAHRDFQNQPFNDDATGTTNAFSVGAYSTLIHPSGFYADLVVKYTQLWNDFDAPNFVSTLGLGSPGTANYTIPTFGASLEIGKRWDFGHFFLEPQGQIEGAWAGGADYTVSNGLRVSADNQTSLRARLGVRAGLRFDWGSRVFEPYAKVSVTNEFLGGDRITTDQTAFFPTLSGVGIQPAGGVTARLTDSIYVYGEYDYANSDKIRMPWAVDVGLRLQW